MLKPFLLVLSLAGAFIAPVASQEPPAGSASTGTTSAAQARARNLYNRDCAMCHGDNGNGQTDLAKSMSLKLPDWTVSTALVARQDRDLIALIRNGKGMMLPEGEDRASDEDIKNLILFIRSLSREQPVSGATR